MLVLNDKFSLSAAVLLLTYGLGFAKFELVTVLELLYLLYLLYDSSKLL